MGILKGALSVRRYRLDGAPPESFVEGYLAALQDNAFRDPLSSGHKEERAGWVQIHNLLDADFADVNRWLYNQYALFALRVDKKVVPAKLFRAHLEKRVAAWCLEQRRERCPASVKTELRELLELEMLGQTLPRVTVHEICWNLNEGWVLFHNQSELANDRFRKLFHRTFGLVPLPWDPLDFLADQPALADAIASSGASDLRVFPDGGR